MLQALHIRRRREKLDSREIEATMLVFLACQSDILYFCFFGKEQLLQLKIIKCLLLRLRACLHGLEGYVLSQYL